MLEFFDHMEPLLKIFWYVAIPSSVIFLIQTILTFIGADASDGLEADFDGSLDDAHGPFQLFSFRNLINFLLGFGWGGIAFYGVISNSLLLVGVATLIGLTLGLIYFYIIKQILKLSEDNTFKISSTIGKTAEVYLSIPATRSGFGKVLITLNGSTRELEAMTNSERIDSHSIVKIVNIENNNILIVEKI